ncbi:hypothetical protein R1flu_002947 [Riccia fluitans]|uniref:Uncharacterized protein n=1 Tax=Riccia fluitans TaxID=41844 RepID=A0ABD1YB08_9MARC
MPGGVAASKSQVSALRFYRAQMSALPRLQDEFDWGTNWTVIFSRPTYSQRVSVSTKGSTPDALPESCHATAVDQFVEIQMKLLIERS